METLNQWYNADPKRLEQETILMAENCPNFEFRIDANGDAYWAGKVDFSIEEEGKMITPEIDYNPLEIKIVCPSDYPQAFPSVYDVNQILQSHGCIHLYAPEKKRICYGTRLDKELAFENEARIKDLIPIIGAFLYGQWMAEKNGGKWENDRFHGWVAFVHHELLHGSIPSVDPCPCGKNGLYSNCCLHLVEAFIRALPYPIPHSKIKLGNNKPCPCGSGSKFKKCCQMRKLYEGRKFYLQSAPIDHETFIPCLEKISKGMETSE